MSTPDHNLFSYTGPADNGRIIDDSSLTLATASPSPEWQDTLKLTTGLSDFFLQVGTIYGGSEDCVDINGGAKRLVIVAQEWHSGGKYVATVKDCQDVSLTGEIMIGGTVCDVDLGNYSQQGGTKVTGTHLNYHKADGSPIRVRVLNAEKPTAGPMCGRLEYIFPSPDAWYHGLVVWLFLTFRPLAWWLNTKPLPNG